MQIPARLPGSKWLLIAWGITAVFWSMLEGDLARVQLFGFLTTAMIFYTLFRRVMAGHVFSPLPGLAVMALWGLSFGVGTVLLTLFLMAVKTGLHAHGPEFTPFDILSVWQRLPLYAAAGLLAGLGLGLLLLGRPSDAG